MTKGILVALAILPVLAQAADTADLTPGTVELAGDARLRLASGSTKVKPSGGTETKTDTGSYVFDASGFYYVARTVGLGLTASYDKETEKSGGTSTDTWTFVAGPAVSVHFPVASQLAVFGQGTVGAAWARSWGSAGAPDISAKGFGYALRAGLKYFPLKQLSLHAGVIYDYLKLTTDEAVSSSGPTPPGPVTIPKADITTSDLAFIVGLSVYFGR